MILAAITILFLASLAIYVLVRYRIGPGYSWFLAVITSITSWLLLLSAFPNEPILINLIDWERSILFNTSPGLLMDMFSWPFAVAITTLLTSVLLTEVARIDEISPSAWVANLAMATAGLVAVLAANPLTLLLSWTVIDLTETITLLNQVPSSQQRERVVVTFSVRVAGMVLVISAILRSRILGVALSFSNIPQEVSGYLILAAGLRLGVLPPHRPFLQDQPQRRGLGTIARLIPVAASLVLLTRVASVGAAPNWVVALTVTSVLALIYGSLTWIWSPNELDGRPFWILGASSLGVIASVRALPYASQAWGVALLFSGGTLFLFSSRPRRFIWLPALSLLGFCALPFTPAWRGTNIFSNWNIFFIFIFMTGLATLILGYLKHMIRGGDSQEQIERWVWLVYPIGLVILPLTHFWVMWSLGELSPPVGEISSLTWWAGIIVIGLGGGFWFLTQRVFELPDSLKTIAHTTFSFGWLYRFLWGGYRLISRFIGIITRGLEGEGGVLWAVLFMILLLTVILQIGSGG